MRKTPRSNKLVDVLHKGFVCTCLAVTIYATSVLCYRGYNYFYVVKPELQRQQLLEKKDLLVEGSSDVLTDTAPSLS